MSGLLAGSIMPIRETYKVGGVRSDRRQLVNLYAFVSPTERDGEVIDLALVCERPKNGIAYLGTVYPTRAFKLFPEAMNDKTTYKADEMTRIITSMFVHDAQVEQLQTLDDLRRIPGLTLTLADQLD